MDLHYKYGGWVAYEDDPIDWERIERDGWPLVLERQETLDTGYNLWEMAGCVGMLAALAGFWGLAAWLVAG